MPGKFNNKKYKFKGITYDSKSEGDYAAILQQLLKEGKIKSIERQVRFKLPNMDGTLRMAYIADFIVTGNSGRSYIIDVKGLVTPEMKVKMAYAQYVHNIKIYIVYNKGLKKYNTEFLI